MTKKERVLTDQQKVFLDALFLPEVKGNLRKAMDVAGYSKNYQVAELIRGLKEEIMEATKMILAMKAPEASFKIGEVMDGAPIINIKEALRAAESILDRVGAVKPTGDNINVQVEGNGIVFLPVKRKDTDDIVISREETTHS